MKHTWLLTHQFLGPQLRRKLKENVEGRESQIFKRLLHHVHYQLNRFRVE